MPDHLYLMWMGYEESSDQRMAMRFLRKQLNWVLCPMGFELQKQGYDHVLREESRRQSVFETVAGYVRDSPLRAGLVLVLSNCQTIRTPGALCPAIPN